MRVLLFGSLCERIGKSEIHLEDEMRVSDLRIRLNEQIGSAPYAIAINGRIESGNPLIPRDAEVALLPPFSGG